VCGVCVCVCVCVCVWCVCVCVCGVCVCVNRSYVYFTLYGVLCCWFINRHAYLLSYSLIYLPTSYLLTYLLTLWSKVRLGKLIGSQLVKKFPAFYGTRMFITAFTSARHLSLFWASSIQSIPPHPTSWRSILILSSHLRLGLPSLFIYIQYINTRNKQRCKITT